MTEARIRSTSALGPGRSPWWRCGIPVAALDSIVPSSLGDGPLTATRAGVRQDGREVRVPVAVEVHAAADPRHGAGRGVLPERPALATPVGSRAWSAPVRSSSGRSTAPGSRSGRTMPCCPCTWTRTKARHRSAARMPVRSWTRSRNAWTQAWRAATERAGRPVGPATSRSSTGSRSPAAGVAVVDEVVRLGDRVPRRRSGRAKW